ncbi:MAG: hypothetical protein OWQ54_07070 [Sulfolobaceae archaeon]|nr:hypothetical protein [Sulfolobaceae archaeon]
MSTRKKGNVKEKKNEKYIKLLLYIILFLLFYFSLGLFGTYNIVIILHVTSYLLLLASVLLIVELIFIKSNEAKAERR